MNKDGTLITDWYRKSTCTGRILHFLSNHLIHQKISMIFLFIDKAILLAHDSFREKNINLVKSILSKNLYPENFINHNIKRRIQFLNNQNTTTRNVNTRKFDTSKTIVLPYFTNVNNEIANTLKPLNCTLINTIPYKLNNLIKNDKDKIKKEDKTRVVYKTIALVKNLTLEKQKEM